MTEKNARASKKQQELLAYIDTFIEGTGYGPSYREVMRALGYKSVSTVATHIDGLIAKGYLRKADHSARSLEVVTKVSDEVASAHHVWLVGELKQRMTAASSEQKKAFIQTLDALEISHDIDT